MNIRASKEGMDVAKTIALSGKPGIGKTQRMKKLADDMKMDFYHVSMPEMDISLMSGLPEFENLASLDTSKYHKNHIDGKGVVWSMPEIIMNANIMAEKNENGVILMLDDLHQTPISTMPYLYQLLNEKSLGNYKLHENVHLVGALNDSEDANFDGIESPVMNRMSFIKAEFDVVEFLEGYAKKFPFQIRSFLEQNPDFVNEEESTISAFGTPRSWNALSNSFEFVERNDKEFLIDNVFDFAASHVSEKASLEFEKHVSYIEKMNLQKYISDKKIFDVTNKKALDQVLLGYLPILVISVDDGIFLGEVLIKNIQNNNFVAFSMVEIYNKYSQAIEKGDDDLRLVSNGVKLVIGKILDDNDIIDNIKKDLKDDKMKKKVDKFKFSDEDKDVLFNLLSDFIA
jgi:hypothetical protein